MKRIKDRDVRAMRAYLHDRIGEMLRVMMLDPFNRTFTVLTQAAFDKATYRRFAPRYTHGDVVRFVARARGRYGASSLDPLLAEYVVLQSIGGEEPGRYGKWRRIIARARLLGILAEDLGLDDDGIEELLDEARTLADEWLRTQCAS